MNSLIRNFVVCLSIYYSGLLYADYKDDIAFTKLATELGVILPDGNSVVSAQVEAATGFVDHDNNASTPDLPVYLPDPNNISFTGKTIVDQSGFASGSYSSHAAGVGKLLYGTNSMASGINLIHAYWADNWLQSGFLNYGAGKPLFSPSRIGNHSWVGNITDVATVTNILRRMDWVIETDEYLQIVGTLNSTGANYNLLSAGYNVLAAGKTDGNHSTGSPSIDSTYPSGRTRTEIVAPFTFTSSSTPAVAATAELLINTGHSNPGLSTDPVETSTSNRNDDTIYNAERSEVVKAALLAGADRYTQNTSTTANIIDYRVAVTNQTDNGMDGRFGAGQVNVYNSYHIIAAGEQNSSQDGGAGSTGIGAFGFDYDPSFGGANGSNNVASYYFTTATDPILLSAALVWHIDINGGNGPNFSGTATFYDLDLYLYDVTGNQTLLVNSTSQIDNSENIWISLSANKNYLLQVIPKAGQSDFNWDYALGWRLASDKDGDGIADAHDNCIVDANVDQSDIDNDSVGDVCDEDIDGDGTPNLVDAFPTDPTETTDTDSDGIGNNADDDDDNDGLTDVTELSIGTNPLLVDTDSDGFSDYEEVNAGSDPLDINSVPVTADGDLNNDGVVNLLDIFLGQQILTGLVPLTADHLAHGDVAPLIGNVPSPDGTFNIGDFVVIQRKALGRINF